jgi:hypothetical protein
MKTENCQIHDLGFMVKASSMAQGRNEMTTTVHQKPKSGE